MHKISTWVVCVNGKHPKLVQQQRQQQQQSKACFKRRATAELSWLEWNGMVHDAGFQASYSQTSCDFFKLFFHPTDWPTGLKSGNAFDAKRQKGGWP